jgi:N-methylhydantoinase B
MARQTQTLDGLQLALISNRMDGIVRAMMNTLLRTARSAIMNMARDFSCVIMTAEDEILCVAESIPIHVFVGPDIQARTMKEWHPDLRPGDAFLHNSPYHGNSHAADWSILIPVIDAAGVHRYTVLAKAHVADCGNSIPTTFFATARDVYEEGALIFPCVKIQDGYRDVEDVVRMCKLRIRVPELWYGDYLAILGAARIGERRLLELLDEVGLETLKAFETAWFDYSEERMIAAIRELPPGASTISSLHDPIPGFEEGIPANVTVTVDPEAARIAIDLRDNLDCQPHGLNLTESTAATAAMVGVFSSLGRQVTPNAGSFRRLDVLLRENCMIGIPRHPASCSMATTNLAEHTMKNVARAIAELAEGFGMAEVGRHMPPAMAVISGIDPREHGGPFINFLCLTITNGAGCPSADGWLTLIALGVAGTQMRDQIEIDEMKYPLEIVAQYIIPDTEGAGRFRGAPGAYVEYGPVDTELEAIYTSDGTHNAPRGVRGGLPGAKAQQYKRTVDGTLIELPCYARVVLQPDETIISMCTGGGGYGPPHERDIWRVEKDVREGWITPARARDVYRVAVDAAGVVEEQETKRLRAAAR